MRGGEMKIPTKVDPDRDVILVFDCTKQHSCDATLAAAGKRMFIVLQ